MNDKTTVGGNGGLVAKSYPTLLSRGFSRQEYWSGLPFPSPKLGLGLPNHKYDYIIEYRHQKSILKRKMIKITIRMYLHIGESK